MRLIFSYTPWLCMLLMLSVSCGHQPSEKSIVSDDQDSSAVSSDTVVTSEVQSADIFYQAVEKFSTDFPKYNPRSAQLIDTLNDLSNHWFLMSLENHRKRLKQTEDSFSANHLRKLPTASEIGVINSIRQGAFYLSYPKNNDVVFEEWNFDNSKDAERWLVLLSDSLTRNEYTKPPRFEWVEGSRLYLVSTRSASQWFEWSDSLTMRISGKTKQQLSHLYNPLDLRHFKKWQGPANSSAINTIPHLYSQKSGPHYSYFYFVKQRLVGEARATANSEFPSKRDFSIITSLEKPLTGNEKFNSIQETIVAVQCGIPEPALNHLDLVGKTHNDLKELFGTMLFEKGNVIVLGHSNRIIVANMDQGKVSIFKYLRLKAPFETLLSDEKSMKLILNFE